MAELVLRCGTPSSDEVGSDVALGLLGSRPPVLWMKTNLTDTSSNDGQPESCRVRDLGGRQAFWLLLQTAPH